MPPISPATHPVPPPPDSSRSPRSRRRTGRTLTLLLAGGLAGSAVAPVLGPGRAGAAAQQPTAPFGIEDVLSAPHPSGLVASPTGERVAWIRNERGARNVWVASAPDWRGRRVTDYDDDTGRILGGLAFTPDGRRLLYGVGGSPNRRGEFPNPASLPRGPEMALWIIDLATGDRAQLSGGEDRALSPDGSRYVVTRGGDVLLRAMVPDSLPEVLFTPRVAIRSPVWSPDGRRLAFVSPRGDHGFVGVYDLDADAITWMAPSLDADRSPVWSPDGRRLAFVRVPNDRDALPFLARPEAVPWSVVVADAETGEGREVWRAETGPGSAFRGIDGPDLVWAGNHLVFPWERDGWLRLWSIPAPAPDRPLVRAPTSEPAGRPAPDGADGGDGSLPAARYGPEPTLLTPGAHEVQWASLDAAGATVLVSSNAGDMDRRHIWRVPADGSADPEPVTEGAGIEWSPVALEDGAVAFLASGPTTPARAEILVDGARKPLVPDAPPEAFPADHMVTPEAVELEAADGMLIPGQLFVPPVRCGAGPHPGLLFFHGGSRRQMLLGFHPRGYYHNAYAFNQYMANRCFVVLAVNYRSGIGYGLDFREAEDYGAGGASELNDVIGAGRWLADRDDVDAERIGLWGGSYGGYLTAMGLARAPELFAAGVDLHGVHDWNVVIANFAAYDPALRPEVAERALASSPLADLSRWEDPVLLIHGDDDRNVPFSESVDLAEALRGRGIEAEVLVFPDEVHGFLRHESWVRAYRAAERFLIDHLSP